MDTAKETMKPSVEAAYEFLEIMNDFTDPREIIREGISNSFDAKADKIEIEISKIQEIGKPEIKIVIKDNGEGMIGIPQNDDEKKYRILKPFLLWVILLAELTIQIPKRKRQ